MTRTAILCLVALALSLLGATCNPQPPPDPGPPPVPPAPTPDPTAPDPPAPPPEPPPPTEATCETACAHQAALGCELGKPTPEGHSCVEVCENVETGPIVSLRWDLECLIGASSCEACSGGR